MSERCKTCKWWDGPFHTRPEWGECTLGYYNHGQPWFPHAKAYAEDEEHTTAYLMTHADFGCVQWARGE